MNTQSDQAEGHDKWLRAPAMRSRFVIEVAAELVAMDDQHFKRARVQLRDKESDKDWRINLTAASTMESIDSVVNGEATLSMINPAAVLTMAYRGTGPFSSRLPLRLITTFPSSDACVLAVRKELGVKSFEDIAARTPALKLSVREQRDHCLHMVFDHVAQAAGFTAANLQSWGGELRYDASPRRAKALAIANGANAVFEEAACMWIDEAIEQGLEIASMSESTLKKLEAIGYRRAILSRRDFARLPHDIATLDFSGWAIFVRADLPEKLVSQICMAVEARKHLIPWQGNGPLPLERMCRDTPQTPMDVPLHPAAERYWKSRGYI